MPVVVVDLALALGGVASLVVGTVLAVAIVVTVRRGLLIRFHDDDDD